MKYFSSIVVALGLMASVAYASPTREDNCCKQQQECCALHLACCEPQAATTAETLCCVLDEACCEDITPVTPCCPLETNKLQ